MHLTPLPRAAQAVMAAPAPFTEDARDPLSRDRLRALAEGGAFPCPQETRAMAHDLLAHRALERTALKRQRAVEDIDTIARALAGDWDFTACAAHAVTLDLVVRVLLDELEAEGHGHITAHAIHDVLRHWDHDPMARIWIELVQGRVMLRGLRRKRSPRHAA